MNYSATAPIRVGDGGPRPLQRNKRYPRPRRRRPSIAPVARTLQTTFRSEDVVARFGGEEFVILFPNRTTTEAAAALERVREQLVLAIAAGPVPGFTASFGVSHSDEWTDLEELLRAADSALFRAKREGRNRVIVEGLPTT